MSIPGLSEKTKSPQSWRRRSSSRPRSRSSGSATYVGRNFGGGGGKFPKLNPKKLIRLILIGGIALIGIGGITSIAVVAWVARDLPNPNRIIEREVAQSTKIYDRTGEQLLFDIHGDEQRTLVPLVEIPDDLIHATLTAEDRKFYEHGGISITGIIRSAIRNVTTGSRVSGSTLTQQLVKNAILTSDKTYTRKIREIILSWQIEKNFSKDEILQLYFNEIPYGSVAYGSEAAAQTYFGKSVRDITLPEAAILAALPQSPTRYSPYGSNVDLLIGRQHWILDSMAELGYITEDDAEFAKNQPLEFKERQVSNITAPHFVMYVRELLTEKYGEVVVEQGGLQVVTTLDLFKHELAEEVMQELAEKNLDWEASNAAMVVIDPKTGQILTMLGSRDFFNEEIDGQVNVATRLRQPGSSFKPIVYTAAFRKGFTPDTVLYDVETDFVNYDGNDYSPRNYDLAEHGPVTIRQALQGSLNIPAVKAIYLAGVDNVIDLAEDLGYTSFQNRSRFGLSLVLGGGEVQLLEHTNAFAALAREGEWHPPVAILEVRDKDGNVLEEYERVERKVLETEVARQINNVLTDNAARAYIFGENNYLTLGGRPVAAKTGSTNDYRDAWTIGYTPSLAVGVWVGNNNNDPMRRGAAGGVVAAPIWNTFMRRVLGDTPVESFRAPAPIETDKPVLNGSIAGGVKVKVDRASGKLATNLTPESMVEERTYQSGHSILYFINPEDPLGNAAPIQSGKQFERWEQAIVNWAERQEITLEQPPTEFDDVHVSANQPRVTILNPGSGATISQRALTANVQTSAPRGVVRVEYYIDNILIANVTQSPFDLAVTLQDPRVQTGSRSFRAVAYDDVENAGQSSITLQFNLPALPSALTWTKPVSGTTLSQADFPLTLEANLSNFENINRVDLIMRRDNQDSYINTIRQFSGGGLLGQWSQAPTVGVLQVVAKIINKDGFQYESEPLDLIVN